MRKSKVPQKDTRQLISELFREKVRAAPLSKLRIGELIDELDINRNTFYYYFSSKYDVAAYIFRKDLDQRLRARYPESELIVKASEDDPFEGLAFYGCTEIGARRLNDDAFFDALFHTLTDDIALYRNLFTYREMELIEYVRHLWTYAFTCNADFILDHRHFDDRAKTLLISFTVQGILGIMMEMLSHADWIEMANAEITNPLRNYPLDSLHYAINKKSPSHHTHTTSVKTRYFNT